MTYDHKRTLDAVDADLFSSDIFDDNDSREHLKGLLVRWNKKLMEIDQEQGIASSAPRDLNLTRAEAIMLQVYLCGGGLVRAKLSYEQAMRKAGISIHDPTPKHAPDYVTIAAHAYIDAMDRNTQAIRDLSGYLKQAELIL